LGSPFDSVVAVVGDALAGDDELLTTELPVPLALQAAIAPAMITVTVAATSSRVMGDRSLVRRSAEPPLCRQNTRMAANASVSARIDRFTG
jgi:hypothetical protein